MPLASKRPDVLPNDRLPALLALGCPSLRSFGLAIDAPCVAVLLDMRHALFEGVAALSAEEVAIVPVIAKSDDMLTQDWCCAMLATGCKQLMPIKVTVEAETFVTIFCHSLARLLLEDLTCCTPANALQPGCTIRLRLGADLQRLQRGATDVAGEALWVESVVTAGESDETPFDRQIALVAASGGPGSDLIGGSRRPVASGLCGVSNTWGVLLWSRKWPSGGLAGGVVRGHNDRNVGVIFTVIVTRKYDGRDWGFVIAGEHDCGDRWFVACDRDAGNRGRPSASVYLDRRRGKTAWPRCRRLTSLLNSDRRDRRGFWEASVVLPDLEGPERTTSSGVIGRPGRSLTAEGVGSLGLLSFNFIDVA